MTQPEGWVKVYESALLHQVVMLQSLLEESKIASVILNQQDSAYVLIGEISLYVSLHDLPAAQQIIEETFTVE